MLLQIDTTLLLSKPTMATLEKIVDINGRSKRNFFFSCLVY